MKTPFKKKEAALAPNDPMRVPVEHRQFINKTFSLLKEKGYSNFDCQVILQSIDLAGRSSQLGFLNVLKTAVEIGELYKSLAKDDSLIGTDLQVLGMKLTEALNKMALGDIAFEEI